MFIVKPGTNILDMLKSKGLTSYTIRRDKTFGEATMQKFRKGGLPSWQELYKLCTLLHITPCDIIAIQLDNGAIYDLTGKIRLDIPAPTPFTVQHGHPGDAGYDPDDPGEYSDIDDDY